MKNVLALSALFVMISASTCFAQSAPVSVKPKMDMPVKMVLTGKVKALIPADAAKGTPSVIIVTEASGKDVPVFVLATTPIADKDNKPVVFGKLVVGEVIAVQCQMITGGAIEAVAIKVAG